jgi:hypothetical protein
MRAMGAKAAITPLTESVEHVGSCRKTAMVFVICLEYVCCAQIKNDGFIQGGGPAFTGINISLRRFQGRVNGSL